MNAAMKEFAQKGYKNASTDAIVKEADISKGALFHYFSNKKGLFLFLYDYTMDTLKNKIIMKFNFDEKDVFARIRQGSQLKLEIMKKHPEIYNFIVIAYMEEAGEVKSDLESRNKGLIANSQGFLSDGIDTSKFKEGIDVKRAINIIIWTIEGFTNKEIGRIKSFSLYEQNVNELLKEMDTYLEMLKTSLYK